MCPLVAARARVWVRVQDWPVEDPWFQSWLWTEFKSSFFTLLVFSQHFWAHCCPPHLLPPFRGRGVSLTTSTTTQQPRCPQSSSMTRELRPPGPIQSLLNLGLNREPSACWLSSLCVELPPPSTHVVNKSQLQPGFDPKRLQQPNRCKLNT